MTEIRYTPSSGAGVDEHITKYCAKTNVCRAKAAENFIECHAGGDNRSCVWCCSNENKCNANTGTLQFVPLERPACFALPERNSSRYNYYQPTGYHYFTNNPVLLNRLGMPGVM